MPRLEHIFVWCWKLDTWESRSEITWKFLNGFWKEMEMIGRNR